MPGCTITDFWRYSTSAGAPAVVAGLKVLAVPDLSTRRYADSGGVYRQLADNPLVSSTAYKYGRVATTDSDGEFTLVLPRADETKPTSPAPIWSLVFPDGRVLSGTVPDDAGPKTLDDLEGAGWGWSSGAVVTAPLQGTVARGTVPVSGSATYVDVLFTGGEMPSEVYQVSVDPSKDSGTEAVPEHDVTNKSKTGFRVNFAPGFTGTFDYIAIGG